MAEAALQMPLEAAEVEERAVSLPEKAAGLRITDQASLERAAEFLRSVKLLRKEIDETFDPICRKAFEAHRAAVAAKKKVEAPVAEAEAIVKRGMGAYQQEQERIAREAAEAARCERERLEREAREREEAERRRLEDEAEERRLAEALAAEERGDVETAARIIEAPAAPVVVPPAAPAFVPPPPPEPAKIEGLSFIERWEFEVVEPAAVPREFLAVDEKKIGGVVRAMKGETKIAGVRVWSTKTVAARAR